MDVLQVPAYARLEGAPRSGGQAQREARLQAAISRHRFALAVFDLFRCRARSEGVGVGRRDIAGKRAGLDKAAVAHPSFDAQRIRNVEGIFEVGSDFVAAGSHRFSEVEIDPIGSGKELRGQEGVEGVFQSGPDGVPRVGIERQPRFDAAVVNATPESKNEAVLLRFECKGVIAVGRGGGDEGPVVDEVVPSRRHRGIAPRDAAAEVGGTGTGS